VKEKIKVLCIHIDSAVCSSWGRRLPKHIFKTQYAYKTGHRYCLNCGLTKKEVREEEKFNKESLIETRIIDYHSDLENPTFLTMEDIKNENYRVFI